ncbi:MAG: 2Fe-2S iron-sulfur cluster binding domain-containing protein, partial [Oscillospiraceae bacterium]|nr:2Fe-2S iron-sulfur cluster binding domain-containing protein [Oscillospiraceae bacterium]
MFKITFLPSEITIKVELGTTVMQAAIAAGVEMDAPCGGRGVCKKCLVKLADSQGEREVLACQTEPSEDCVVTLSHEAVGHRILLGGITRNVELNPDVEGDLTDKLAMAYDIGTTTVASYLIDLKTGAELATSSLLNPQTKYGGDVIMRINYSLENGVDALSGDIRAALGSLALESCKKAKVSAENIALITIVGN